MEKLEEFKKLIRSMSGHKYELLYKMAIAYGLKKYEVANIEWKDVDFENNTIGIYTAKFKERESINKYNWQYIKEDENKRVYPLIPYLRSQLLEVKENATSNYVFTNLYGERVNTNSVARNLKTLINSNELSFNDFSDLRFAVENLLYQKEENIDKIACWCRYDLLLRKENLYRKINLTRTSRIIIALDILVRKGLYIIQERKIEKENQKDDFEM
ncbi:MAG: tyrosine-type recombinase/integrase [Spirochaetales bacterium]